MLSNDELCTLAVSLAAKYQKVSNQTTYINSRKRESTIPRQIAHWLLKTNTTLGFPTIGKLVGNKTHATVIHSVKQINNIIDTEPRFRLEMLQLSHEFNSAIKQEPYDVYQILSEYKEGVFDEVQTAARLHIYYKQQMNGE